MQIRNRNHTWRYALLVVVCLALALFLAWFVSAPFSPGVDTREYASSSRVEKTALVGQKRGGERSIPEDRPDSTQESLQSFEPTKDKDSGRSVVEVLFLAMPGRNPQEGLAASLRMLYGEHSDSPDVLSGISNQEGIIRFDVNPGSWGLRPSVGRGAVFAIAPGETKKVEIPLYEMALVWGRVVDEEGQPVEGAFVCRQRGSMLDLCGSPTAVTDAAGSYRLRIFEGAGMIVAWKPGFQVSLTRLLPRMHGSGQLADIVLSSNPNSLRVQCLTEGSLTPVPDVVVEVKGDWQLTRRNEVWVTPNDAEPPKRVTRRTDTHGVAEFTCLPVAGHYTVQARCKGYIVEDPLDVVAGMQANVEVLLRKGRTVCGHLSDVSDDPMPGIFVSATPWPPTRDESLGTLGGRIVSAATGPGGRFVLEGIPDGWVMFRCERNRRRYTWRRWIDGSVGEVELKLDGTFRKGRLPEDIDAEEVARLVGRILVRDAETSELLCMGVVNSDGTFTLSLPDEGDFRLQLLVGAGSGICLGSMPWHEPAGADETILLRCDLDVSELGSIFGRIEGSNMEVAPIALSLLCEKEGVLPPSPKWWPQTGQFASDALAPGEYLLVIQQGKSSVERRIDVGPGEKVDVGIIRLD